MEHSQKKKKKKKKNFVTKKKKKKKLKKKKEGGGGGVNINQKYIDRHIECKDHDYLWKKIGEAPGSAAYVVCI